MSKTNAQVALEAAATYVSGRSNFYQSEVIAAADAFLTWLEEHTPKPAMVDFNKAPAGTSAPAWPS